MKKIMLIIITAMFLIPFDVKAASITGTQISGKNSVNIGESFSLSFHINYSGIQKTASDSPGIAGVIFELEFDDNIFSVTGVSNGDEWDTIVGKSDGKYYVFSTIRENSSSKDKCADDVLYCGNYVTTLTFYVKDTNVQNADIKMTTAETVLFKVNSDYSENDAILLSSTNGKSHNISINKTNNNIQEEPPSIASNSKPNNIIPQIEPKEVDTNKQPNSNNTQNNNPDQENKNQETSKNNNTNLSSLKIKNYDINFEKGKTKYVIYINKNINKLKIEATPEEKTSTIKIKGADNLKKNNYEVEIEVTAENNSKKTYTVVAKTIKQTNIAPFKIKLSKKNMQAIIKVAIIASLLLIPFFIIIYLKNRKLNKLFDDLDNI